MSHIPKSRKLAQSLKTSTGGMGVISGTFRNFDLFHAFRDAAKLYSSKGTISKLRIGFYDVPKDAKYDDLHPFWESEDADHIVYQLCEVLDAIAPDDYYFGHHEYDGSDYGWWKFEDNEPEFIEYNPNEMKLGI